MMTDSSVKRSDNADQKSSWMRFRVALCRKSLLASSAEEYERNLSLQQPAPFTLDRRSGACLYYTKTSSLAQWALDRAPSTACKGLCSTNNMYTSSQQVIIIACRKSCRE